MLLSYEARTPGGAAMRREEAVIEGTVLLAEHILPEIDSRNRHGLLALSKV
jgi:hypothetical protein